MTTAQIDLKSVSKVYAANGVPVRALSEVDLEVAAGEFTVLAGPSGSGKSTLLHLVGALDQPTTGQVRVAGEDLSTLSRQALAAFRLRRIGFVFQAYNLVPVLTALENVEYTLLLQGVDRAARRGMSLQLLRRVGLEDQISKRPGEMSGGQQQRVAVARALATKPEIVLADEPTANLDSETGAGLIELFRELNRELKTTFLFASHDSMVIGRAGRVIQLKDGRIAGEVRR